MNIRELLIRIGVSTGSSEAGLDRVDKRADKLKGTFEALNGVLALLGGAATLKTFFSMAESMQNLQAQVGNATGDLAGASAQLDVLAEHAKANRTDLETYVGSWAKMNQGVKQFGGTSEDTTKFMDTLSAAFKSNGTATESANAALFQLSQTMQSGIVQGEEMNSLADANGSLYHDLAVEIGGTVDGYKKMQAAGKVTAKMLMEAVNKQLPKYQKALQNVPRALSDSWRDIKTDVLMGVKNLNNQLGFLPALANKIDSAWRMVTSTTKEVIAGMGGLASAVQHLINLGTPLAALLGVFMGFKALSFLTSPIGLVLALAAAIGLLWDDYKTFQEGGQSLVDWKAWQKQIDMAKAAIEGLITVFKKLTGSDNGMIAMFEAVAAYVAGAWAVKMVSAFTGIFSAANAAFIRTPLGAAIAGGLLASKAWDGMFGNPDDVTKSERYPWLAKGGAFEKAADWWTGQGDQPYQMSSASFPGSANNYRGAGNVTNSGNVTNNITVVAAPGQSPDDVAKSVQQRVGNTGGFNPESLMNAAGAR